MIIDHATKERDPECPGEEVNSADLLIQTFGYFCTIFSVGVMLIMGKTPMLDYPSGAGAPNYMFPILMLELLLVSHFSIALQVCHVVRRKFSPLNQRLVYFALASVLLVYFVQAADPEIDQQAISDFAWFILGACLVCQWHFIVSTVKQMASSLGINIFTVRDKVSDSFTR